MQTAPLASQPGSQPRQIEQRVVRAARQAGQKVVRMGGAARPGRGRTMPAPRRRAQPTGSVAVAVTVRLRVAAVLRRRAVGPVAAGGAGGAERRGVARRRVGAHLVDAAAGRVVVRRVQVPPAARRRLPLAAPLAVLPLAVLLHADAVPLAAARCVAAVPLRGAGAGGGARGAWPGVGGLAAVPAAARRGWQRVLLLLLLVVVRVLLLLHQVVHADGRHVAVPPLAAACGR